jgi:plasmid stability protein
MKKRTNYNLDEEQHQILRIAAAYRGVSASKLLRQILDEWIEANVQDIQVQVVFDKEADSGN